MRRLLLFVPLGIAAAVMGFSARMLLDEEHVRTADELPSALVGNAAPDFALPGVPGLDVPGLAAADLASDGVTAVNVWASWCVPCRAEHGVLTRLVEAEGLRLVGLNYRDGAEGATAFLAELGNPYERVGFDERGRTGIDWGVTGVPETFLVGPDGTVLHRHAGPIVGEPAVSDFRDALAEARAGLGSGT
jgi:cytochrome c biogenesis protein CcmG/thiol:disulfide interchange protein DsbE